MPLPLTQIGGAVKSFVKPIGKAFQGLGGGQKAAVGLTGGLLTGKAISGGQRNTTINKLSFDEISENAFGELPKGKAEKWAKKAKGKHLPEKTASDEVANKAFIEELNKLASEKGLKKLIKKIHKTHPEAFSGIGAK